MVSPGLPLPLEMIFPHEGVESPDEPQASQPFPPSQQTDILPAPATPAELRRSSRFRKQPELFWTCNCVKVVSRPPLKYFVYNNNVSYIAHGWTIHTMIKECYCSEKC